MTLFDTLLQELLSGHKTPSQNVSSLVLKTDSLVSTTLNGKLFFNVTFLIVSNT